MENKFDIFHECSFLRWDNELAKKLIPINCGEDDLNDFFCNEAVLYSNELLGKTYVWVTNDEPHRIVAAFTVSNDSIKSRLLPRNSVNRINRPIKNQKRGRTYPAVLIGRLGVDVNYQGKSYHVGTQIIDFIKQWFSDDDNKTGCRFMLVDAYNNQDVLSFYQKNGFKFLYPTEQEESEFYNLQEDEKLHTRMMYMDLK